MPRVGRAASISILSLVFAACAIPAAHSQQDKSKEKQPDRPRQAAPLSQQQDWQDQQPAAPRHDRVDSEPRPLAHPRTPSSLRPISAVGARSSGQPKQVQRSPDEIHDQQLAQQRAWPERRANHFQYERRTWQQRGGYQGFHVPDDYFRDHYGSAHVFRIDGLPFIYKAGDPSFQYDGYWFTMVDPYPENWTMSWYQDDDVFVDYRGDGYYLFNRSYPKQLGIALNIAN